MASAGWAWVAEVASEELAKLEAAHPGRASPCSRPSWKRLVADPGLDAAAFPLISPRIAAVTTTTDTDTDDAPAPSSPLLPARGRRVHSRVVVDREEEEAADRRRHRAGEGGGESGGG
ncbi:hypothetical protein HU200_022314 [Digitaria exilis]|uniref:Uncharacterized protein n=1 Tax=Digitaria exilis TaxID=1010633 RepID=A0A835EVF5_9POAL|nr:hypothetical protein HU200_022314 [Digitaria exilis]